MGRSEYLQLASLGGELQRVIDAWDRLPRAIRNAILALALTKPE
jgi:hypothetical protein